MSIAEELITYLAEQGVGILGQSLFIGLIPDGSTVDDFAICLNVIGGQRDRYVDFRHALGSFVVRAKTHQDGTDKYEQIASLLHKNPRCLTEFVHGGKNVKDMYILDEPTYVGQDESKRYIFEFQIRIDYV